MSVALLRVEGVYPVETRGCFVEAEANLVREDLLMNHKDHSIVDVLLEEFLEIKLPLRFLVLSDLAQRILYEIYNVKAYVNWRMDERRLFMQCVVEAIYKVWLIQGEHLEAVGESFLFFLLIKNLIELDVVGELRHVHFLVH
jgi:hypothetical protein